MKIDGKQVFVSEGGNEHDAGRPTLVLIHGSGADHTVWALQTRYLAYHGVNVAAVDLPGHGRSAGPPLTAVADIAVWLARVVDGCGAARVNVLGHSLGALAAAEFATRYPDRCGSVLLAGVAKRMPVNPALLSAAGKNDPLAVELLDDWCHSKASQIGGHPVPGGWMTGGTRRLLNRARPGVIRTDLAACNAYRNMDAAMRSMQARITIIAGSEDRMTPAAAGLELAESIPQARFERIEAAGHNMMLEQPGAFNRVVLRALAGNSSPVRTGSYA